MAKKETLQLDVKVRGDDDVKDLADNLEEVEDASKKAQRSLDTMLTGFRSEIAGTESAVKALGDAFGQGFDPTTGERFVAMLRGMDVPFQDIIADADKFAAQMKEIDGVRLEAVSKGVTSVSTGLDKVTSSSNQSRSVMANFAGNAVGDLGNVAGATGALNVMLGQLAEYASEGGIKLSQLASVAGPMAGIGVGMMVVQHAMEGIAKQKAFETDQVEAYAEAIDEIGIGAEAVRAHLDEVGKIEFAADSGILGMGTAIKDITGLLDNYSISVGEFSNVVAGSDEQLVAWADALMASSDNLSETTQIVNAAKQAQDRYQEGLEKGAARREVYASTIDSVTDALNKQAASASTVAANWGIVTAAMQTGTTDMPGAVNSWNNLRNELHLTDAEMAAMAEQKLDEKLEADAAAAEAAAEAQDKLSAALINVNAELNTAESRTAGFTAALERLDPGRLTEGMEIAGFVDDLEALGEAVSKIDLDEIDIVPPSDDWQAWKNMPDEAQAVLDAMSGFRDSIDAEMTQAFTADGAAGVREWAAKSRQAITDELRAAGVESEAAINQVLEALGLLPEQVTTTIELAVDEQKLGIVDDIISGLGEIPPNVAANISVAVNNHDPDEAFAILNDYLTSIGEEPVVVTVNAETGEFMVQMDYVTNAPHETTIAAGADTTDAEGQIEDVEDASHETTIDADADTAVAARQLLNETSKPRTAHILTEAHTLVAGSELDGVAEPRTAIIRAHAQTNNAEYDLNYTARRRDSYVYQHAITLGGFSSGGGGASTLSAAPAGLSASPTAAAAPMSITVNVPINAAVIGDRYAVQRTVTRAVRGAVRVGGARLARAGAAA